MSLTLSGAAAERHRRRRPGFGGEGGEACLFGRLHGMDGDAGICAMLSVSWACTMKAFHVWAGKLPPVTRAIGGEVVIAEPEATY